VKWLIVHTFGELAITKVAVSWALLRTVFPEHDSLMLVRHHSSAFIPNSEEEEL
jgi:hypothetical protein